MEVDSRPNQFFRVVGQLKENKHIRKLLPPCVTIEEANS